MSLGKKCIILRHYNGNLGNNNWSYEAREIEYDNKKGQDLFIARVSAKKMDNQYSLFVEHIEYDEEGKIQFRPEKQMDLSDSNEVDKELKRKLRTIGTTYAQEKNIHLEDKLDEPTNH